MHTSSHGRFYFPPGPKRLRVRRVRSRTAAESVCGLDLNIPLNPSRETKFSGTHGDRGMFIFPVQLTTSRIGNLTRLIHTLLYVMTIHIHTYILTVRKTPELTKLQASSYVGVRYTWPLELARETELRWKNHLFC